LHPPIQFQESSLVQNPSKDPSWLKRRLPKGLPAPGESGLSCWTYERYFEVIREVISRKGFSLLLKAAAKQLRRPVDLSDIKRIVIHSEKHGSFYHPAKIRVFTPDRTASFVMNVALGEPGKSCLFNEFKVLHYLNRYRRPSFLPAVYFRDETALETEDNGCRETIRMFLADWLEGYFEFHPSANPAAAVGGFLIWDGREPSTVLSRDQMKQLYFQAAYILTHYFDPATYRQIYPWHHAAGDFVVKAEGARVLVKLVTARRYGSLMDTGRVSPGEALLFFFLNLSLRMPLDRLDGSGEITWNGEGCLEATWLGFIKALKSKEKEGTLGKRDMDDFRGRLKGLPLFKIRECLEALLESYDARAPEVPVIQKHLDHQAADIKVLFKSTG
jgi:hypothetical protein